MLLADPPEHTRLRKLVSRAFLPRRMALLRPRIQELTDDLIDAFPECGELDLLPAFAFPLPLMVICEFLGIPYEDRPLFLRWGRVLSQDPSQEGAQARERRLVNDEVVDYFTKVLAVRRADAPGNVRDDLIGDLVRAADTDGMFSDEELISTIIFLIIAGHKTTANLIGNGMEALLRHPDTNRPLPPRALGGPEIPLVEGADPREALFQWMRSPDNPFFARSFVNRVWGHYFGVGLVDPVDNFSLANPPSNEKLLDALARDFIASKFDIRRLERTVLNARVYQLSSAMNETNRLDRNNYSHSFLRQKLGAERICHALRNLAFD